MPFLDKVRIAFIPSGINGILTTTCSLNLANFVPLQLPSYFVETTSALTGP